MAQPKKVVPLKLNPKETDEVISFFARALNFGQKNLTAIIIGLAVVLIAAALYGYWQKRQVDRLEQAAELFQAVVGRQQTDIPNALKELETIIQDYPGTGGALQARLLTANLLYQQKNFQEAAAAYEALGKEAPELNILVTENLSYCYEAQKDYQKAASVLNSLVETANLPYRQELQRRQALLLELAGAPEQALAIYEKMLQDNPPQNFIPYLQEKIKVLGLKKK